MAALPHHRLLVHALSAGLLLLCVATTSLDQRIDIQLNLSDTRNPQEHG